LALDSARTSFSRSRGSRFQRSGNRADGKRFLIVTDEMSTSAPDIDVTLNWPSLVAASKP
jgi:hypothetical protein